jgi:Cyclin, N-terminal domain
MEFEGSTQAKSWLFDQESLGSCKQRAVTLDDASAATTTSMLMGLGRIRKFASGYHHTKTASRLQQQHNSSFPSAVVAIAEQEQIIQFHCHQLRPLIGPNALLPDLRTSEVVLATAITFLRRFYLSNSVVDISPRKMAVACAFFAAKVEEEKIEVGRPTGSRKNKF